MVRACVIIAAIATALTGSAARADGTLSARGVYYKERATRVVQPMLDGMFEIGSRGLLTAHLLVDTITSASASAGADNATPFTEFRTEGGAGYTHQFDLFRIGGDAKYSTESDYQALYAGVRSEIDLAQKNTVLGLGGGVGRDRITGGAAQGLAQLMLQCDPKSSAVATECHLSSYSLFASASQILGPNTVVGLTYDLTSLHGYQSNPYRSVITETGTLPEKHPDERLRTAVAGSLRYYLPASQTTWIAAYRYYRDDWKVYAHTPELRIVQQVGENADASVRYRYYTQTGAFFYRERYTDPAMFPYLSDDVKLSAFTSHTLEAKLGVLGAAFGMKRRWSAIRFEGILEYVVQHNRFGNAIIAHLALTVPFDY